MRTAKKVIVAGAMAGALLSIGGIAYADSFTTPPAAPGSGPSVPALPGTGPSVPAVPSHSFGGCIVVGSDGMVKVIKGNACVGDPNHVAHVVPVPARPQS